MFLYKTINDVFFIYTIDKTEEMRQKETLLKKNPIFVVCSGTVFLNI
jgi:hypothetical protein